MKSYKNKSIWIIGASSGIGAALAREISGQGASLILSSRREEELDALNEELGGHHTVLPLDVGNTYDVINAAAGFERLDSVVFLAAKYAPHSKQPKSVEFVHSMINVNLGGAYNTVHAAMPLFESQGCGQIVLCGSVAGFRGLPYGQPYCSTKAAIINYAESLRIELEHKNIDVKLINPGFVRTPLTDKNDFPMPMMIEAPEAGAAIARDMLSKRFEIHFPKRFTYFMKLMNVLPRWIYFSLARFMKRANEQ